jgi:hypothetical protein
MELLIMQFVHAPTKDKINYMKDRFYEERVFDKFPSYQMKILLGDFMPN